MKIVYIAFTISLLFMHCNEKAAKEKYRIPYGYKGQIFIFFNIKDGAKKEYENGYRVYNIPASGILKTRFKAKYGYRIRKEYIYVYVDSLNNEYPLKSVSEDYKSTNPNEVYVTGFETGEVGNKYQYQTFNIITNQENILHANHDFHKMDSILKKAGLLN